MDNSSKVYKFATPFQKTTMLSKEEIQEELRKQVEGRFGLKPELRRHFDALADRIFEATNEQISSTTLRRFWGYQEDGKQTNMRTFTLDILSHYVEYRNWTDFQQKTLQTTEAEAATEAERGKSVTAEDKTEESTTTEAAPDIQPDKEKRKGLRRSTWLLLLFLTSAVVVTLFLFTGGEKHYDFEAGDLFYTITSEEKATVELTYDDLDESMQELDITIPETVPYNGKTYTVTAIGDSAFAYKKGLIAIVIPSTITRIGAGAFKECRNLTHINMPDAITEIGDWAMRSCVTLNSIRLSSNLEEIPAYCFSNCKKLEEVEIPAKVKVLRRDAFGDCFKLRKISLPEHLDSIGRGAFWNCYELKEISIPGTVQNFGDYVFWGCKALKNVYLHNPTPVRITNIFKKSAAPLLHVPEGTAASYKEAIYWSKLGITEE